MKNLLSKTTKPFLVYVLIVLVISIPVYYIVVDTIWLSELDEHNEIIADKSAHELNKLKLSDEELEKSIALWNMIQPGTNIEKTAASNLKKDLVYTTEKHKSYSSEPNTDRFRCLKKIVYINKKPYLFTVETNVEETQETVMVIAVTTIFFFIVIVAGLLILNRRLSNTVWKPFHDTLNQLKSFNLSDETKINFAATDVKEFEELNTVLTKLIDHNISVYTAQKEFTENASHELQTPLAVLQNKLDILLQDENITERQYVSIEELNKTLARSTRINKNLLLLAKIENLQFAQNEMIPLSEMLHQSLEAVHEHFEQKQITVNVRILDGVEVYGNRTLTETLINNLLINAVKHTPPSGTANVELFQHEFVISNTGQPALNKETLFKRFSKSSSDTTGSGLGLAIVKKICTHQKWIVDYNFQDGCHHFFIKF
ncbi:signal transduction histidine kinase [Chryseobacterium sp. H1D6B]|uniref:sensor histidine kinase n=1 Tax=Chryseobacterium sp. H1D6B TaxID=2940588 RepID=UPI0015C89F98|nr:HAMP domain-containing sensor histidine kinase [Chryseobacterium sp. H1D6B]MDH6253747.1 signal transduction histidine kinase [Chryseobacterium sp. H1D6B]